MHSIYYSDIKTQFTRICPDLNYAGESTLSKQSQRLQPPGLTIVAKIAGKEESPFKEAIQKIQAGRKKFCSNEFLHFTLLGLFNDKRQNNQLYVNGIVDSAKQFIEQKHLGAMTFRFNLVRLGAFYKNGRPIDCDSDGTLVAMADADSSDVNKYNVLGDDLAFHLRNTFPIIFYQDLHLRLKREHQTVWVTLGYFNEANFELYEELVSTLEELKLFNTIVNISQLEVRSYENRSLENSNLVDVIKL